MPIHINHIKQLPDATQQLLTAAQEVSRFAYNRYSGFFVGAALLTASGEVVRGTFMENASFGLTICAEAAALVTANSAGATDIVRAAVVGGRDKGGEVVTPCGRCRQLLFEAAERPGVSGRDIEIYCANLDLSKILLTTARELLPLPFGPNNL